MSTSGASRVMGSKLEFSEPRIDTPDEDVFAPWAFLSGESSVLSRVLSVVKSELSPLSQFGSGAEGISLKGLIGGVARPSFDAVRQSSAFLTSSQARPNAEARFESEASAKLGSVSLPSMVGPVFKETRPGKHTEQHVNNELGFST